MNKYPIILSLADGTDVVIEPTNETLTITVSMPGNEEITQSKFYQRISYNNGDGLINKNITKKQH